MTKTEFEKAFDTISSVEQNLGVVASTTFEKSEQTLHPVKRLVQGKNGERYYRTYWVADYQVANQAQRDHQEMASHAKKLADAKKGLDKKPDDQWYKDRHIEAQTAHDKAAARLEALDKTAVKKEDRQFKTKKGVPAFVTKQVELEEVEEQIKENQTAWEAWAKEGPDKVRAQAKADYKKVWEDSGLKLTDDYGDFQGKVMSADGKTELLTIQHRVDYNFKSDSTDYEPKLEVRLRHSSFDTKDPADFAYMSELSDGLAKVTAVTKDPAKMKELNDLRMKAHGADKTDARNEFSEKGAKLRDRKNQLEKEIIAAKVDDVIAEMGNDSFELKSDFHFGTGRKYAPRYRYAKVIKTTPKQVEVGFSDSPGNDGSFYNTKKMNTDDFRKFVANHVDLDAHLPHYTGESTDEVKGAKVETAEHKDTAKKLDVKPEKLGEMINEDHKKEAIKTRYSVLVPHKKGGYNQEDFKNKIEEITGEKVSSIRPGVGGTLDYVNPEGEVIGEYNKLGAGGFAKKKSKDGSANAAKPAPALNTGEKKVVGHEKYNHPQYGEYNKGDKVTFEHKGEMKSGKVIRVNEYQRFPNPYVLMEGSDGKKYEIVISKVNVRKDKEDAGGASGKK